MTIKTNYINIELSYKCDFSLGGERMLLEINKLINSDFGMLKKLGWLLYDREDQIGGLTKEELYKLLHIVSIEEVEKEYQEAYNEGFNDGVCE